MAYTKAIVDLEAIRHNFRLAKTWAGQDRKVMAVLKADAYGHGAVEVGAVLAREGADCFAVATLEEALELKAALPQVPILILGAIPPAEYEVAAERGLPLPFMTGGSWRAMAALSRPLRVHLKVNTGLERLGFAAGEADFAPVLALEKSGKIRIEGIFSHLSQADGARDDFTAAQLKRFRFFLSQWQAQGLPRPLCHLANSAGVLSYPDTHFDLVRVGLLLYGANPLREATEKTARLRPAMSLVSAIAQIHWIEPGAEVGYGGNYVARERRRIATVPVGYADGYKRILNNRSQVLVGGVRCPQVGNVCMDQVMVDITGVAAAPGDEVVLFGGQGAASISVEEIAAWAETNAYEVLTSIGKRVRRVYGPPLSR